MLSEKILAAMHQAGGLKVKKFDKEGNLHLDVNYKIIDTQFPGFLEEIINETINDVDRKFYAAGLIAPLITDEGDLLWKPTRKWLTMVY